MQGRATAFKHLMVPKTGGLNRILDQVDIGVTYATDADDVLGSARAKKSYNFGSKSGSKGGSGALEFFGEADVNTDQKVSLPLNAKNAAPLPTVTTLSILDATSTWHWWLTKRTLACRS